jgi:hypothetical protein
MLLPAQVPTTQTSSQLGFELEMFMFGLTCNGGEWAPSSAGHALERTPSHTDGSVSFTITGIANG